MTERRDDPEGDDLWQEIEAAAPTLRREWDSPLLWPRIAKALGEETRRREEQRRRRASSMKVLRLAAAAAATIVIGVWAAQVLRHPAGPAEAIQRQEEERRLLTEQALARVEDTEAAYVRSIDALAQVAAERLQDPATPLLMSYREKLALLDAAIAECRAQSDANRFNAHLRRELLSMYQEKQRTLEQLLREGLDDRS